MPRERGLASRRASGAAPLPSLLAARLAESLDPGEAAAIALGVELQADLLVCDDLRGRQVAEAEGLDVVGTLGILLRAKQAGHLEEVKPVIGAMLALGFRATPKLVAAVLGLAGEG